MKKWFIIIIFVLSVKICYAGFSISTGGNLSTFNTNNSHSRYAFLLGVNKTWDSDWYGLSFGVQYIKRDCLLKDITMVFLYSDAGYHEDVLFSVSYFEFPLLCSLKIMEWKKFKFRFNFGPALGISLNDNSKSKNLEYFSFENDPEFRNITKNLYLEYDDPDPYYLQSNSGFYLNLGFVIEYQNIFIEPRYSHGKNKLNILHGLNMHGEKFRTLELILGVRFNNEDE
jgi:hypothetical protein